MKRPNLMAAALLAGAALLASPGAVFAQAATAQIATGLSTASVAEAHALVTADGTRANATNSRIHILPSIPALNSVPKSRLYSSNYKDISTPAGTNPVVAVPHVSNAPLAAFPTSGDWSPADLKTYGGYKGNVTGVTALKQNNVYLNCPAKNDSCWGTAAGQITGFQSALSKSTFMKIVDQYVGSTAADRYPLGKQFATTASLPSTPWNASVPMLTDSQAQALALAAANTANQFGYGYIYHIFAPKGTDVCFDSAGSECYSPDHSSSFYFCGYHGSFDVGQKHILYSVEPYDAVIGCSATGQSVVDAQASVLSHELFEAITDPDPNLQWNAIDDSLGEIGDICAWRIFQIALTTTQKYNLQLEYSNKKHACSTLP